MMKPTAEQVRELLDYDPETGVFVWKAREAKWFCSEHAMVAWNRKNAGKVAGTKTGGYVDIRIQGQAYGAHRLAWLYITGVWPPEMIDHIDRNPSSNKIANLRLASCTQNLQNAKRNPGKYSRHTGVSWNVVNGKWQSHIRANGKKMNLGYYDNERVAAEAYLTAKELLHTHRWAA